MIDYTPLWETMKKRKITTYALIKDYKFKKNTIGRMKHNMPITTVTLNDLCRAMQCNVEDVIRYVESENDQLL